MEKVLYTWCVHVCNTVRTKAKKKPLNTGLCLISQMPFYFLCLLKINCSFVVFLFSVRLSAIIFLFPLFVTLHYFWCCNSHLFPLLSSCLPLFHFLIPSFTLLRLFFGPFSVGFERIPRRDSLLQQPHLPRKATTISSGGGKSFTSWQQK